MDESEYFRDVKEAFKAVEEAAGDAWRELLADPTYQEIKRRIPSQYYHRDGTPIVTNELMPDFLQWAMLFETDNRRVAQNITLYGERLSTVFLGLDHSYCFDEGHHTPILFETMLFAPRSDKMRKATRDRLTSAVATIAESGWEGLTYEQSDDEKRIEKKYPHDSLQLRYATEREAQDKHEELKMQCLIPPRWRRFLLYTIGGDATWE